MVLHGAYIVEPTRIIRKLDDNGNPYTDGNTHYDIVYPPAPFDAIFDADGHTLTQLKEIYDNNFAELIDLINSGGGGGGTGVALINVTATANDVLTCVSGATTLNGTIGAEGTYTFALPFEGSWVVTNVTNGRSATVSVTAYTSYNVFLGPAVLQSIAVTTMPTKTQYLPGEMLNLTGIAVTATWDTISPTNVTSGCTFSPVNGTVLTAGIHTITVTYSGKTTTFTINAVDTVFGNNSISTIQTVSEGDIALNNLTAAQVYAKYGWSVGDVITPTGGSNAGIAIPHRIIGFNTRTLQTAVGGRTKAGIELQPVNCYGVDTNDRKYMNSSDTNTGSWNSSYMRTTVMPLFKGYFSSAWQAAMKTVSILTAATYNGTSNQTTNDSMYLLAAKEIFGGSASAAGADTSYSNLTEFNALTQSPWYAANNVAASRVKNQPAGGSAYAWWERSPYYNVAASFCNVTSSGYAIGNVASYAFGVAPCFCI
jgi:hypothetical protein